MKKRFFNLPSVLTVLTIATAPEAHAQSTPAPPLPPSLNANGTPNVPWGNGSANTPPGFSAPPMPAQGQPSPAFLAAQRAASSGDASGTATAQSAPSAPAAPPPAAQPWPDLSNVTTGNATNQGAQQTINAKPGVNYVIPVSGLTANLLSTPFANPTVISPQDGSVKTTIRGSQVFFTIEGSHPVGVFITGDANDPSISLTLIPRQIPGQTYFLSVIGYTPHPALNTGNGTGQTAPTGMTSSSAPAPTAPDANDSDYVAQITDGLSALAKGDNPDGYNETSLNVGPTQRGALTLTGQSLWIGNGNSIAVFSVKNSSSMQIPLAENDLWQKGVLAISFYPLTTLQPGDTTTAYVVLQNDDHGGFGAVWQQ